MKKNIYIHSIDLKQLKIKNKAKEEFRQELENIPYRGYIVEELVDGRKVIITKPGGKRSMYGKPKKEDFMVFVFNENDSSLWLISHNQIKKDLEEKSKINSGETIKIIDALERIFNGEEPEEVLNEITLTNPYGEPPELLLKVYKWIWGQEDCNYPNHKGRLLSMEGIFELRDSLKQQK